MASNNMANLYKNEWLGIQSACRIQHTEININTNRKPSVDIYNTKPNTPGKKFSDVLNTHLAQENRVMAELKKRQKQIEQNEKRKYEALAQHRVIEDLRQEQQKTCERKQKKTQAVTQYWTQQMKEKQLQREKERQQDKKDGEYLRRLDQLHAEEQRREMERKAQSKKINLKNQLEDIRRSQLQREKQRMEREKLQIQTNGILLNRKREQPETLRRLQVQKDIVSDKLAAAKEKQAATRALQEQQRLARDTARREAECAKQRKEKEEKRAAALQSVSDHRQKAILQREQDTKAERHNNLRWLQANKEADALSAKNQKLKAQKLREERIKLDNINLTSAAERRARLEQGKKEELASEVRNAKQTSQKQQQLHQYVTHDLLTAAQRLCSQEPHRLAHTPPCSPDPPMPAAAEATSFALYSARLSNNPDLRYRRTTIVDLQQTRPSYRLPQASAEPFKTCPPPI